MLEDIKNCVEKMAVRDLEVFVHNYSRPDIPFYTAKTIVPGLCHIWPQFGNERLYSLPVTLGWQKKRLKECELNPIPLLV